MQIRYRTAEHNPSAQRLRALSEVQPSATVTKLGNVKRRVRLLETATTKQLERSRDPFIQLALKLRPVLQQLEDRRDVYAGAIALDRPRYVEALRVQAGGMLSPDANATLRVT